MKLVKNGIIIKTSRKFFTFSELLAIKYAEGYPNIRQTRVDIVASLKDK
ncbi:MAG: hypothetical protein RBS16_07765 [Candidatus Cloacimonadales bacterium]|nr:hypothetical protein [Candidatus Cloacimonadales bacterium]